MQQVSNNEVEWAKQLRVNKPENEQDDMGHFLFRIVT